VKFMCVYYCTVKLRTRRGCMGRERAKGVKSAYCKLLCNTALHSNAKKKKRKRKNAFGNVVVSREGAINSELYTDDMKTLILCIKIVLNSRFHFPFSRAEGNDDFFRGKFFSLTCSCDAQTFLSLDFMGNYFFYLS
jgi:hypothetical protein